MADPQLEHGHLRLANLLAEAIVYASFNGTQFKVVLCLIRLTYGWRVQTVRISHAELAERCRVALTGGFRRSLDELLREGVLIEVERGSGRTPASYQVNKNFEAWGRLSVPAGALERLYGERPTNVDGILRLPPQGPSIEGQSTVGRPERGTPDRPERGIVTEDKSLDGADVEPPKTTTESQSGITSTARVKLNGLKIVMAANRGLAEHTDPKRRQNIPRILPGMGSTVEAVEELEAAGVTQDFAESAVYDIARSHRADGEIKTLRYFTAGTIRQFQQHQLAGQISTGPRPAPMPSKENRREAARAAEAQDRRDERDTILLEREYSNARHEAIERWAATNRERYDAICADVIAEAGEPSLPFARKTIDIVVDSQCAQLAGFPSLEEWAKARRAS